MKIVATVFLSILLAVSIFVIVWQVIKLAKAIIEKKKRQKAKKDAESIKDKPEELKKGE